MQSQNALSIETVSSIAAHAAIEKFEELRKKEYAQRVDRRLSNTKLIFENYAMLKKNCQEILYDEKQFVEDGFLGDLFVSEDEDVLMKTIMRTHERTGAIMAYIDNMLEYYKTCGQRDEEISRKYTVLFLIYLEKRTIEDISQKIYVSEKTVIRLRDRALKDMSTLLFGFDGLRIE